jgi:D-lyxose ketol-isomerase
MKRSEINAYIDRAAAFIREMGFRLPPFAFFSPQQWAELGPEYDEIKDNMLGWDLTDFGSGDYENIGLLLFTLRNGNLKDSRYTKTYAEKLLLSAEGQVTPCHFHFHKMEDIINRGGGNLMIQLWNSTPDGSLTDTDVQISSDGRNYTAPSGTVLRLAPGQSITLYPGQYHSFWAENGYGGVMAGEVSMVNDDVADNRFLEAGGRFPSIEEDEAPRYLLCNEYPRS